MNKRGRVKVRPNSWHWRWYKVWSHLSNKSRMSVDLCHYMRVLLFFAPWRWFWQYEYAEYTTPFTISATLSTAGALAWTTVAFPAQMVVVWLCVGLIVGGLGLCLLLAMLIEFSAGFEDFCRNLVDKLTLGIYWLFSPFWGIALGAIKLWRWKLEPGLHFFFNKRLFFFSGPDGGSFAIQPWGLALIAGWLAVFAFFPLWVTVSTGGFVGLLFLIFVAALAVLTVWEKWLQPWGRIRFKESAAKAAQKAMEKEDAPPGFMSIFWHFLVSKKHRICPLIETS